MRVRDLPAGLPALRLAHPDASREVADPEGQVMEVTRLLLCLANVFGWGLLLAMLVGP